MLLVEQQPQRFLLAALVGGAGLDGDQALLFKARLLKFFFLLIEALELLLALFQLAFEALDLFLQAAHFLLGALQFLLHAGFLLLQLFQQLLQLGHVGTGGFQLLLGLRLVVGKGRDGQAGEENEGEGAEHGGCGTWSEEGPSMPAVWRKKNARRRQPASASRITPGYCSWTMVLPVISAGTGMPIRVSRVGATSASTPPSRMVAGRLPT